MKTILYLGALFLFIFKGFGGSEYYGISDNGLTGYIDSHGDVLVEPQFETGSGVTSMGSAWVTKDEKQYFLDVPTGQKTRIPAGLSVIPIAWRGYYIFVEDGVEGIIHFSGEVVLEANEQFSLLTWLRGMNSNGVFYLKDEGGRKEFFTIGKEGKKIIKFPTDENVKLASTKYFISSDKDKNYKLWKKLEDGWTPLFKTTYRIGLPSEDRVLFRCAENSKYGFLDLEGEEAFSQRFPIANDFVNGYALISEKSGDGRRNYFINRDGEKIIFLPEDVSVLHTANFQKGLEIAIIRKGEFYGVFTMNETFLIKPYQDFVWRDVTYEGLDLILIRNDEEMAWFNLKGEMVWQSEGFKLRTEAP
ncbi:MAG: WG repeat-containing protein [Opitutales bacterium]|nr:WG repeat-containing protein [Opitutales bacterium]